MLLCHYIINTYIFTWIKHYHLTYLKQNVTIFLLNQIQLSEFIGYTYFLYELSTFPIYNPPTIYADKSTMLERNQFMNNIFNSKIVVTNIINAFTTIMYPDTHIDRSSHCLAFMTGDTKILYTFESTSITVSGGQLIYIPKGSSYSIKPLNESKNNALAYAINFEILEEGVYSPICIDFKNESDILSLFIKIIKTNREKLHSYHENSFSYLYKILSKIHKTIHLQNYTNNREKCIIQPAIQYIKSNYTTQTFSIKELANICKVSDTYFRQIFKKIYGTTPAKYIQILRLSYAKELLSSNSTSITDIVFTCGFNDVSYFSRAFKEQYGLSPRAFKKSQ